MVSGFDIHSIRSACIIKTEISHFSYMSVISEGYMIMESLAIENFIAQLNSCGIAVRTIFSDCVANYRELQENIFCTLVCYAAVNHASDLLQRIYQRRTQQYFFQLLLPCLSPLRPIYSNEPLLFPYIVYHFFMINRRFPGEIFLFFCKKRKIPFMGRKWKGF